MGEKVNRGKQFLVDKLELPKDVVLDVPKIIVTGREEITIENHKGILVFGQNEFKINTSFGPLTIEGSNFEILYIAAGTITISGRFKSIKYEG